MDKLSREQKKGILWLNLLFAVVIALVLYSFVSLWVNFFVQFVIDGSSLFFPFLSDENILWFIRLPDQLSFIRFSVGQLLDIFVIINIMTGFYRLYVFRRDYWPDVTDQIFFKSPTMAKMNPNPYYYSPGFAVKLTSEGKNKIIMENSLSKKDRFKCILNPRIHSNRKPILSPLISRSRLKRIRSGFLKCYCVIISYLVWNSTFLHDVRFSPSKYLGRRISFPFFFNFRDSRNINEEGVVA